MIIYCFDYNVMVYEHAELEHTNVIDRYYMTVLKTLTEYIRQKRHDLIHLVDALNHDNARPHVCNVDTN